MKRLLALLLAVLTVLSLAACGTTGEKDPTQTTGSTTSTDTTDPTEDGRFSELFLKESYTAEDDAVVSAKDTVVATLGDAKLTNSMLQIYYWLDVYTFINNYGSYLSYFGLDHTSPLDKQDCPQSDGSWQHYFLKNALNSWQNYQALALMADATNTPMDDSMKAELEKLPETLADTAEKEKFESVEAMLQRDAGPGCTLDSYLAYMEIYYKGYNYFNNKYSEIEITDAMIEEYFTEHEKELAEEKITKDSGNVHDVRHILVPIEGGTKDDEGKTTYSDAEWAACQAKAQDLLDQWLAGEATEETFADFAVKHSTDTGSASKGGLYTDLDKETNFVEEFKNWYLDESRKPGDYGLVKSTYGYHIMYYSASEAKWFRESEYYLMDELAAEIVTNAVKEYTLTVDYDAIVLAEVDLATE